MQKIPVHKNRVPIEKRGYFSIILLFLLFACGCGSCVVTADSVRIIADPISGDPPLTVSFSADVQSSVGAPARYVWSLGDGERRGEKSFSYTYTEEGTYRVNLVVQFEDGSFGYADIIRITVGNPSATPVSIMTTRATTAPTKTPTSAPTAASTKAQATDQTTDQTPAPTKALTKAPSQAPTFLQTEEDTDAEPQPKQTSAAPPSPFSSIPVIIRNNDPIYPVTVSASPVEGIKSHIVSFAVKEAGTKVNRPTAYSWNFGDGSRGGGPEPRHVYQDAGTYHPVVRVNFADRHEEILQLPPIIVYAEMPVGEIPPYIIEQTQAPMQAQAPASGGQTEVSPPLAPGADLYVVAIDPNKDSGKAPLLVRFGYVAEGGVPLVWQWDFGDGEKTTIAKPSHSYNVPGTYVVQLSVQFYGAVWIEAEPVIITVG